MAERKAVNKYYPPDWDPRKGSANKRVGQHPLRDRAKKLSQGILVIRFELPYNIWCGGCGSHVGMGVRYNAEKSKVGNYYSTPIFKFRMKCHLCDNYFEIQTDPKNHDYVILCGARRKEQRWDPVANEQVVPEDKATQKKLATDAMFKLEHGSDDHLKGAEKTASLSALEESKISMVDDYILNRMARDNFRAEKKQIKEAIDADNEILKRNSLDISLVEETEEDRKLATLMKYSVTQSFEEKQKERRKSIELRPIFADKKTPSSETGKELKQKLGKSLERFYKDPFQANKEMPILSSKLARKTLAVVRKKKTVHIANNFVQLSVASRVPESDVLPSSRSFNTPDIIATQTSHSETAQSSGPEPISPVSQRSSMAGVVNCESVDSSDWTGLTADCDPVDAILSCDQNEISSDKSGLLSLISNYADSHSDSDS